MRREAKIMNHQIEQLKEEIAAKVKMRRSPSPASHTTTSTFSQAAQLCHAWPVYASGPPCCMSGLTTCILDPVCVRHSQDQALVREHFDFKEVSWR